MNSFASLLLLFLTRTCQCISVVWRKSSFYSKISFGKISCESKCSLHFSPSLSIIHKILLEIFWIVFANRWAHRSNMVSVITSQNKNSPWKSPKYWEYKLPDLPKKYWHYDETLNAIDNNSNISAPTVSLTRNCRYNVSIDSLSLAPHVSPGLKMGKIDLNFLQEENKFLKIQLI